MTAAEKKLKQFWMFPRPHRRLTYVPQTLNIFLGIAEGQKWQGNNALHIEFENALDRAGYKNGGDYIDRAGRGRGGSGGRTHAALFESLGLIMHYRNPATGDYEVRATLAGEAIASNEAPHPILKRLVLSHQFPSAYSVKGRNPIDGRFQLRPAVLILRLLLDERIAGSLTYEELAACVLCYGERHTTKAVNSIVDRILAFREYGMDSLESDFIDKFYNGKSPEKFFKETLHNIAHTFCKWMEYTGFVLQIDRGISLNVDELDAIHEAVKYWGRKALTEVPEEPAQREVFQRRYGLTDKDTRGDNRKLNKIPARGLEERKTQLVLGALQSISRTRMVLRIDDEVRGNIHSRTGLPADEIQRILERLIPDPETAQESFLNSYQQMAFAGRDEATEFEVATGEVFENILGLRARHVGQTGRKPDLEIRPTNTGSWLGLVDTKAYSSYDLPSDHQLRMKGYVSSYIAAGENVEFFTYISGGFSAGFNAHLQRLSSEIGVPGSGFAMYQWLELLRRARSMSRPAADSVELMKLGRQVTSVDIEQFAQ